jgi:hypothetical protein
VARHLEELGSWHRQLAGAVHYVYLPYAEEYLAQDPTLKLVRRAGMPVWLTSLGAVGRSGWGGPVCVDGQSFEGCDGCHLGRKV